jgi:hypothetical protein
VNRNRFASIGKLLLLCTLGVGANFLLNTLCFRILKIPLFLDTVFTAAVSFAAGPVPGIATALLTYAAIGARDGTLTPFILCSIAEVLLICRLNPARPRSRDAHATPELLAASSASILAKLILLYIAAAFLVSVMGGVIDFLYHNMMAIDKPYFTSEDTFKINLLQRSIPLLPVNILARIPINIVDRFIVIFGGYFISRGLRRVTGN